MCHAIVLQITFQDVNFNVTEKLLVKVAINRFSEQ